MIGITARRHVPRNVLVLPTTTAQSTIWIRRRNLTLTSNPNSSPNPNPTKRRPFFNKNGQKVQGGSYRPEQTAQVLRFRQFVDTLNNNLSTNITKIEAWFEEFLTLSSLQLIGGAACGEVVRVLHNLDRYLRKERDTQTRKLVHSLVERVRQAYIAGSLPSTSHVPLHLLGYYKESGYLDEGLEFWRWLSAQEADLDPIYAGAAIELLAVYGAGLRYCEDVYERTILQQKGTATQYLMSSGAILPDRSKAVTVSGTSLGLLQGMLSAQLLYGNWQRSYLTLDTAFKLRPTQMVPRFLDMFVYERPIFEAIPVFFMYCRGGNVVSSVTLTALLNSLKSVVSDVNRYDLRIQVFQAMFSMLEAYVGSAGRLGSQHLNILISAFLNVVPPKTTPSADEIAMPAESDTLNENVVHQILEFCTHLFVYFHRHNVLPNSVTFGEIISRALSLGHCALASTAFDDMLSLDIVPTESISIGMIKAAAVLQDPYLLKSAWACIRKMSHGSGNAPDVRSWKVMADAAKTCHLDSFIKDELATISESELPAVRSALQSVGDTDPKQLVVTIAKPGRRVTGDVYMFLDVCTRLSSTLSSAASLQGTGFQDLWQHPFSEPTVFKWPERAEDDWQRKLYDELSTDQASNDSATILSNNLEKAHSGRPDVSNTGIAFDELRYLNWKTINNLLVQTEIWKRPEESIARTARGRTVSAWPKKPRTRSTATGIRYPITVQQLEAFQKAVENERATQMTEAAWRSRILRLRNPEYENQADKSWMSTTRM